MTPIDLCDTPVADIFPPPSLSTFLTSEFVESRPDVRAASLPLEVVPFFRRQLGVRKLLVGRRRAASVTNHCADRPAEGVGESPT